MWKTCQEPSAKPEVMTKHSKDLRRQTTATKLALFFSQPDILNLG
jgi:hypothetical protein